MKFPSDINACCIHVSSRLCPKNNMRLHQTEAHSYYSTQGDTDEYPTSRFFLNSRILPSFLYYEGGEGGGRTRPVFSE